MHEPPRWFREALGRTVVLGVLLLLLTAFLGAAASSPLALVVTVGFSATFAGVFGGLAGHGYDDWTNDFAGADRLGDAATKYCAVLAVIGCLAGWALGPSGVGLMRQVPLTAGLRG